VIGVRRLEGFSTREAERRGREDAPDSGQAALEADAENASVRRVGGTGSSQRREPREQADGRDAAQGNQRIVKAAADRNAASRPRAAAPGSLLGITAESFYGAVRRSSRTVVSWVGMDNDVIGEMNRELGIAPQLDVEDDQRLKYLREEIEDEAGEGDET